MGKKCISCVTGHREETDIHLARSEDCSAGEQSLSSLSQMCPVVDGSRNESSSETRLRVEMTHEGLSMSIVSSEAEDEDDPSEIVDPG